MSLKPRLAFTFFSAQKVNKKTPNTKNSLLAYLTNMVFNNFHSSRFPDFILTRLITAHAAHKIERLFWFKQFCIGASIVTFLLILNHLIG
jgi:hypothetical protein